MDTEYLRKRGWSEKEMGHAQRILGEAEAAKHPHTHYSEHLNLWVLVFLLAASSVGISAFLLPVFLFLKAYISIPLALLLGICTGMAFAFALRSLRLERRHHVPAAITLFILSFLAMTFSVQALVVRFRIIPGAHLASSLLVTIPFVIGMVAPYVLDRRLHAAS